MGILPEFQDFGIFLENQEFVWRAETGGRGRIRTDERTKRADLQSASFSHLDTLPAKEGMFKKDFFNGRKTILHFIFALSRLAEVFKFRKMISNGLFCR